MPTTRAAALPPRRSVPPVLQTVPASDFVGRAAEVGLDVVGPLSVGGLVVDVGTYTVRLDGEELDLSPRQVELLALFVAAGPRTVWSREQLHWVCWGDSTPSRRVDVQLCRLRTRTGRDLFRNVRDRGWSLRPMT